MNLAIIKQKIKIRLVSNKLHPLHIFIVVWYCLLCPQTFTTLFFVSFKRLLTIGDSCPRLSSQCGTLVAFLTTSPQIKDHWVSMCLMLTQVNSSSLVHTDNLIKLNNESSPWLYLSKFSLLICLATEDSTYLTKSGAWLWYHLLIVSNINLHISPWWYDIVHFGQKFLWLCLWFHPKGHLIPMEIELFTYILTVFSSSYLTNVRLWSYSQHLNLVIGAILIFLLIC